MRFPSGRTNNSIFICYGKSKIEIVLMSAKKKFKHQKANKNLLIDSFMFPTIVTPMDLSLRRTIQRLVHHSTIFIIIILYLFMIDSYIFIHSCAVSFFESSAINSKGI